jgi:hypothetical protein
LREAYAPVAEKRLREIGDEAKLRFQITSVALWHQISEASVAVSPHHGPAFDAAASPSRKSSGRCRCGSRVRFRHGEQWVESCAPSA